MKTTIFQEHVCGHWEYWRVANGRRLYLSFETAKRMRRAGARVITLRVTTRKRSKHS